MDVEDFIDALASHISPRFSRPLRNRTFGGLFSDWHRSFIMSVADHVRVGRSLSTNQAKTILKLVAQARPYLLEYKIATERQIAEVLIDPTYRQPPYESNQVPREVRYIGNNFLAFRCKANPIIIQAIKELAHPPEDMVRMPSLLRVRPRFDWSNKVWIVPVFHYNLSRVCELITEHRFQLDFATRDYLGDCHCLRDQPTYFEAADDAASMAVVNVADDYVLAAWLTEMAGGIAL